jgi:hypothetical protein
LNKGQGTAGTMYRVAPLTEYPPYQICFLLKWKKKTIALHSLLALHKRKTEKEKGVVNL